MSKKVAFAGLRHGHILSLYNRIKDDPRFEIVAVCEENEAAASAAAKEWSLQVTHRDFEKLLADVDFDILAIGDYYGIRGQRVIAGLQHGKDILCDKPLCTSLSEFAAIKELVGNSGRKVGLMLDLRDSSCVRAAKKLIDSGRMGKIHAIAFGGQHPLNYGSRPMWYFEKGKHGGTINDIAIHALDAVEYLTGHKITDLTAGRCWNAFSTAVPEFKDSAQVMFALDDQCGCIGDVSYAAPEKNGYTTPFYWRFTLWGSGGVMEFCPLDNGVHFIDHATGEKEFFAAPEESLSDYLEIFMQELNGVVPVYGTAHLLSVTEKTLKLQQMADMA